MYLFLKALKVIAAIISNHSNYMWFWDGDQIETGFNAVKLVTSTKYLCWHPIKSASALYSLHYLTDHLYHLTSCWFCSSNAHLHHSVPDTRTDSQVWGLSGLTLHVLPMFVWILSCLSPHSLKTCTLGCLAPSNRLATCPGPISAGVDFTRMSATSKKRDLTYFSSGS